MKRALCAVIPLVLLALCAVSVFAAVPRTISYQGYLTDASGVPVNGTVSMTFGLYTAPAGTVAPLWTETQGSVPVEKGVYSVVLGSVTPLNLPFDAQYYLGTKIAADAEMSPRQPLKALPYAVRASSADVLGDGTVTSTMLQDGAVGPDKLADTCLQGQVLRQGATGWECGTKPY